MAQPHTICSECSRQMPKAKAVRNGRAYCGACHKRLSNSVPCRTCGKPVRVHEGDAPLCKTCGAAGRKCLRCGKPVPRAGLTLPEGVSCASCAPYFKSPKPCAACGEMSLRLARSSRLGHNDPVCPKCQRIDHAVCAGCGKHRLPAGRDGKGRPLCRGCLERGEVPFVCSSCGKEGKRHSASRCEECYWTERLGKAVETLSREIVTTLIRDALPGYTGYLGGRCGAKKGYLRLNRHTQFFMALDKEPLLLQDPRVLVERFGADGLRRYALPYGFLVSTGVVVPAESALVTSLTERRRQLAIISTSKKCQDTQLLTDFHHHLLRRQERYHSRGWRGPLERFSDRTVTVCLRAAAHLLNELDLTTLLKIDGPVLTRYLCEFPGQTNPVRQFICFLNQQGRMLRRTKIESVRRGIDEKIFLSPERQKEIIRGLSSDNTPPQEGILLACMLLYCQTIKRAVRVRVSDVSGEEGKRLIRFAKVPIELPQEISGLLDRHLAKREQLVATDPSNPYLFPGRLPGSHLSEAGVGSMLRRHGVKSEQLLATGVALSFQHGLKYPTTLARAFGISTATAIKYYQVVSGQLINEVVDHFRTVPPD